MGGGGGGGEKWMMDLFCGVGEGAISADDHIFLRAKQAYVSPSDTIMSPCTAKLSAYKSKQFGK